MSQPEVLEAFNRALALEARHVSRDPGLLFQQLQNRLQWEGDEVRAALNSTIAARPGRRKALIRLKTELRESKALIGTIDAHKGGANGCAIALDAEYVVSVGADGMARQWDRRTGQEIRSVSIAPPGGGSYDQFQGGATCCALSPDGEFAVCGGAQGSVCIWEPSTGRELWRSVASGYTLNACSVVPDGTKTLWAKVDEAGSHFGFHGTPMDSLLHIRQWSGEERTIQVKGHVRACAVSPDGTLLALAVYGAMEGHVEVRNLRTGAQLWKDKHPPPIRTVLDSGDEVGFPPEIPDCAFTPDGGLVLTASRDSTLRLWNTRSGTWVRSFALETRSPLTACAVTPDGAATLSGSRGGTLTLWETTTGIALARLEGHGDEVTALTIAPDGRFAASASRDETVRIWDLDIARGG